LFHGDSDEDDADDDEIDAILQNIIKDEDAGFGKRSSELQRLIISSAVTNTLGGEDFTVLNVFERVFTGNLEAMKLPAHQGGQGASLSHH